MLKIIILSIVYLLLFMFSNWIIRLILLGILAFIIYRFFFKFEFDGSQFWVVFGLPGSGKTTFLAEICRQCLLKGIKVLSNVPITGTYKFEREDLGKYDIRDCVIVADEASIGWFKRDYKNFSNAENSFHSLHRHYNVHEIYFAQTWDGMDLRLRELNTKLFYVEKFGKFIHVRRIQKSFTIDEHQQPIDGYEFVPLWHKLIYAPRVWKSFDSFDAPKLPEKRWRKYGESAQKNNENLDRHNNGKVV